MRRVITEHCVWPGSLVLWLATLILALPLFHLATGFVDALLAGAHDPVQDVPTERRCLPRSPITAPTGTQKNATCIAEAASDRVMSKP